MDQDIVRPHIRVEDPFAVSVHDRLGQLLAEVPTFRSGHDGVVGVEVGLQGAMGCLGEERAQGVFAEISADRRQLGD